MTVTWEMLNAYVDNELDLAIAANVAAAVARDSSLASRVASLMQLRAVTRRADSAFAAPPLRLPSRRLTMAWRPVVLAASLVVAIGLAALLWLPNKAGPDGAPLSAAIAAQRDWLANISAGPRGRLEVEMVDVRASALPDLSVVSLRLAHLSIDPSGSQGSGVLAGYIGPSGCRIGLWIAPHRGTTGRPQPVKQDRDELMIRSWSGDEAEYVLLGHGIDAMRLDRIAALIARITLRDRAAPPQQIAALEEARHVGPPCRHKLP